MTNLPAIALPLAFQSLGCREIGVVADGCLNTIGRGRRFRNFADHVECAAFLRSGGSIPAGASLRGTFTDGGGYPDAKAAPLLLMMSRRMNPEANAVSLAAVLAFLNPLAHPDEIGAATASAMPALGATAADAEAALLRSPNAAWLSEWRREVLPPPSPPSTVDWAAVTDAATDRVRLPGQHRGKGGGPRRTATAPRTRLRPASSVVVHEDLRCVRIGSVPYTGVACDGDPKEKRRRVRAMGAEGRAETKNLIRLTTTKAGRQWGSLYATTTDAEGTPGMSGGDPDRSFRSAVANCNAFDRLALRAASARQQRPD